MSNDTVTVTAPVPAPTFFAKLFGLTSVTTKAQSTATWSCEQASTCTSTLEAEGDCYVAFAYDTSCAGGGIGVFDNANNTIIDGGAVKRRHHQRWQ
jgi:hypothetical protein